MTGKYDERPGAGRADATDDAADDRERQERKAEGMKKGGMVPLHKQVWGSRGGMWSWDGGANGRTWIDWMWVSEGMQEGGIQQVGVTVSTTPGSDHRAYVVDLDTEVVMGGSQHNGGGGTGVEGRPKEDKVVGWAQG